jgi:hypothetical protein
MCASILPQTAARRAGHTWPVDATNLTCISPQPSHSQSTINNQNQNQNQNTITSEVLNTQIQIATQARHLFSANETSTSGLLLPAKDEITMAFSSIISPGSSSEGEHAVGVAYNKNAHKSATMPRSRFTVSKESIAVVCLLGLVLFITTALHGNRDNVQFLVRDVQEAADAPRAEFADAPRPEVAIQHVVNCAENKTSTSAATAAAPLSCWDHETFDSVSFPKVPKEHLSFFKRGSRSCMRAKTNQGDEASFLPLLNKLKNNECVNIMAFGGSITCELCSLSPDVAMNDN